MSKYAILLDGGFLIKKLQPVLGRFPEADDIERFCVNIKGEMGPGILLRIYFYHAPPAKADLVNPISRHKVDLSKTKAYFNHRKLLDGLELKPDFAVRLGETSVNQWRFGNSAMKSLLRTRRQVQASDLIPNVSQKGVDLRIGLDISRLALCRFVDTIVVVTGDSDLVPAFKFARREGVRIDLKCLGHGVRRDLKGHADRVLHSCKETRVFDLDVPKSA